MAAKRKTRREKAAPAATPGALPEDRLIDAALSLAAGRGWQDVALADIAGEAGMSLAEAYGVFRSRAEVLDAFTRRIDRAVLAGGKVAEGTPRERVFELLMRRFDALSPHKAAIAAIARDSWRDPVGALCRAPRLFTSMAWTAEAADVPTTGVTGLLRVQGIAGAYLLALRTWLQDDSADHAKTMAALDRALRRCETLARSIPGVLRQQPAA